MPQQLYMTGSPERLDDFLKDRFTSDRPNALFCSFAYVSTYGASFLKGITKTFNIAQIRLICDTRDCVTHPEALRLGLESGWRVRTVHRSQGTFHPKFMVAGDASQTKIIASPRLLCLGSGNLSRGGLISNIECGYRQWESPHLEAAVTLGERVWALGTGLTDATLKLYEKRFQQRNKKRSVDDLDALGVSDVPQTLNTANMNQNTPEPASFSTAVADAAWTGLESFTGDYTFQVEFPSDAAQVLNAIINSVSPGGRTPMLCTDGQVRELTYAYYVKNGMFRLNIPNDVPGVAQARASHSGIALVELAEGHQELRLTVTDSPAAVTSARARSLALGTWGKTTTRLYGWY